MNISHAVQSGHDRAVPVRWWNDRWNRRTAGALAVAASLLLPLGGLLAAPGMTMEEGFMLLLPQRVAHGAVAYRDFHWFWGPGGLYLPAAVGTVFGWSLAVSRLIGFFYTAVASFSAWSVGRRWSELGGVFAGCAVAQIGGNDLPVYGSIALSLLAVATAARGADRSEPGESLRWPFVSGLLAGTVLLYRPTQFVGVVLALLVFTWRRRTQQIGTLAGAAIPVAAFAVYALVAGLGRTFDNVVSAGLSVPAERRLPIPPLGSTALDLLFFLAVVAMIVVPAAGAYSLRAQGDTLQGRALLAVGILSLLLLPEILQRDDSGHVVFGLVAIGFGPAAAVELARGLRHRAVVAAAGWAALVLLIVAAWPSVIRPGVRNALVTVGLHHSGSIQVSSEGRSFSYSLQQARLVKEVVSRVDSLSQPGDSVFVGPADLRRTFYADNSIAVLLPRLHDSMSFPDMHPTVALDHMAALTTDIRRSQILVLDSQFDRYTEPNELRRYGADTANVVVRRLFCPRGVFGPYQVYSRCR